MAEYGEWNRKGATLSDVTAKAEYGVSRDFILKGIQTGKLEYREGSIWGNPHLRVLRSQLEKYIAEELGEDYLLRVKNQNTSVREGGRRRRSSQMPGCNGQDRVKVRQA
jgi:hypothetical protein